MFAEIVNSGGRADEIENLNKYFAVIDYINRI